MTRHRVVRVQPIESWPAHTVRDVTTGATRTLTEDELAAGRESARRHGMQFHEDMCARTPALTPPPLDAEKRSEGAAGVALSDLAPSPADDRAGRNDRAAGAGSVVGFAEAAS